MKRTLDSGKYPTFLKQTEAGLFILLWAKDFKSDKNHEVMTPLVHFMKKNETYIHKRYVVCVGPTEYSKHTFYQKVTSRAKQKCRRKFKHKSNLISGKRQISS